MLKISYTACPCLSQLVSVQFALEKCVSQPKITKKNPSGVIKFAGNQEPVYDFLLVINSNLGPISHQY